MTTMMQVGGFPLALDGRCYVPETHLWVKDVGSGQLRIGLDPLGVETNGTLAQLSFVAAGVEVVAGRPFGHLEAAKFVGPLLSPVSGLVVAVNDVALTDPAVVERDPLYEGWLIEVSPSRAGDELASLLAAPDAIVAWYTAKIEEYRLKGVIAE